MGLWDTDHHGGPLALAAANPSYVRSWISEIVHPLDQIA